jgi:hypothetical protein
MRLSYSLTFMYVTISASNSVSMRGHGRRRAELTIVTLSLFAQPGEESLAVTMSISTLRCHVSSGQTIPLTLFAASC